MNTTLPQNNRPALPPRTVNWKQVGAFIGLTFLLTGILNFALWRWVGYASGVAGLLLQLQMLLPAFSAILLSMFFFPNSPIYFRTFRERPRWFFYFFLFYTLVYAVLAVLVIAVPDMVIAASAVSGSLTILGLLVLIALRAFSGRESFARAGLSGGSVKQWLGYGAAFILFYVLQTALNAAFSLGTPANLEAFQQAMGAAPEQVMPANIFFLILAVQTVLVGPFIGLVIAFGEEYGWRGYLQGELIKIGKKRGILLLGLIWSVWHYPVILMGHNYPGYPLEGVVLMTGYTTLMAFILGYVMLKTGSVLLVAFLHALNNQVYSFLLLAVYEPASPIFSFGAGIYGILTLAVIVLLLLRDPIWKDEPVAEDTRAQSFPVNPVA